MFAKSSWIGVCLGWLAILVPAVNVWAGLVTGKVIDANSGEPLSSATIRVEGTGRSMSTNDDGRYRLQLAKGTYRLKASHVGHYSQTQPIEVRDSVLLNFVLDRSFIEVQSIRVYERSYDAAQEIILQAIANKQRLLRQLDNYDFDAYTRLVARDSSKPDSESVFLIAETQLQAFWEYPDKYKEIITARQQTANVEPEGNLLSLGEILNFNQDRINLGPYSIASPTATDALDHYRYYLLDTIRMDDRNIFRLELEPKNEIDPLFTGTIDIVDSSFAVVGVDVGLSPGAELVYFEQPRYTQRLAEFDSRYWLPVEISFQGVLNLPVPGLPSYAIDYRAAIHDYRLEPVHGAGVFDYALEVDPKADNFDSTQWSSGQLIPLTSFEQRGYAYRDSLKRASRPIGKRLLRGVASLFFATMFSYDLFHFNRVEGPYLGLGARTYLGSGTSLAARAGWAFSAEQFQHRVTLQQRLWQGRRLDLTLTHQHNIVARPSVTTPAGSNSTFTALWMKSDAHDYFRQEGFSLGVAADLVRHLRLGATYDDYQHYSEAVNTDFSIFMPDELPDPNPPIQDGHLRLMGAALTYDSRPLVKNKHREEVLDELPSTIVSLAVQRSDPDVIESDFEFTRYTASVRRDQRLAGLGVLSAQVVVGGSEGGLPPQEHFQVDYGNVQMGADLSFKTLGESRFVGDRVAFAYANHNFGLRLWQRSRIPLVKDIPFSLGVHGGAFVSNFDHDQSRRDKSGEAWPGLRSAERAYSEIGFSIGRIPPLSLQILFTWQLSDHDTNHWSIDWAFGF